MVYNQALNAYQNLFLRIAIISLGKIWLQRMGPRKSGVCSSQRFATESDLDIGNYPHGGHYHHLSHLL